MANFYRAHCWIQTPSSPARTARYPRLRVSTAHHEWNHDVQALVALDKGFFREEGLEDVELIAFDDDEDAQIEALTHGLVDVSMDPLTHKFLTARDRGVDIYIVAPRRKMHSFVFVGQKGMKSIADLKGMTVQILPEGEATHQLRQLLRMEGLELGKDVPTAPRTSSMHDLLGMRKSFVDGESPTVPIHPWEAEEWEKKGYPILADTTKIFAPRQDRIVAALGSWIKQNGPVLKAFLKAYIQASRFIVNPANSHEIRGILERAGFLENETDRENYDKVMEGQWYRLSADGNFALEGVDQVIREQREAGRISDRIKVQEVIRLEALRLAQRELGIYVG